MSNTTKNATKAVAALGILYMVFQFFNGIAKMFEASDAGFVVFLRRFFLLAGLGFTIVCLTGQLPTKELPAGAVVLTKQQADFYAVRDEDRSSSYKSINSISPATNEELKQVADKPVDRSFEQRAARDQAKMQAVFGK